MAINTLPVVLVLPFSCLTPLSKFTIPKQIKTTEPTYKKVGIIIEIVDNIIEIPAKVIIMININLSVLFFSHRSLIAETRKYTGIKQSNAIPILLAKSSENISLVLNPK